MKEGICKLCEQPSQLRESHVIPKSIYRWIKDTSGTGILRAAKKINKPVQDGYKYHWLCNDCEQKFGKYEHYFFEKLFKPVNSGKNVSEFDYDERLFYFLCSIWWRMIHQCYMEEEVLNCKHIGLINDCEKELKAFLNSFRYPINFDQNYLLLLGEVKHAPEHMKNVNFIFLRTIDPLLMFDDDCCYLSLRIPHFYFFYNITGLKTELLKLAQIYPAGGKYIVSESKIEEPNITSFISQRIDVFNEQMEKRSETQSRKTSDRHKKNYAKWMNSKSFDAWKKDREREENQQ